MLNEPEEYKKALWAWFLPQAHLWTVYGAEPLSQRMREHLDTCGIDYETSDLPYIGTVEEFASTFDDNDKVSVILSHDWRCNCQYYGGGRYHSHLDSYQDELAVKYRISLGEIIQGVLAKLAEQDAKKD